MQYFFFYWKVSIISFLWFTRSYKSLRDDVCWIQSNFQYVLDILIYLDSDKTTYFTEKLIYQTCNIFNLTFSRYFCIHLDVFSVLLCWIVNHVIIRFRLSWWWPRGDYIELTNSDPISFQVCFSNIFKVRCICSIVSLLL